MANKGGTITLKDIIEKDALEFGDIYAKNVEKAIEANERLKRSAKGLTDVMNAHRSANSNYKLLESKGTEKNAIDEITAALRDEAIAIKELTEEKQRQIAAEKLANQIAAARQKNSGKKALEDEALAHKKVINSIKQEEQLEKSLNKAKQETLKTDKAAADLANKIIAQEAETIKLMQQEEVLAAKKIATEKEETRLLQELEALEQKRQTTQKGEISLLQQEERLKRERLATLQAETKLTEQEQRIIKNTLDIKSKELNIAKQEEAAIKRNTVLTAEEKVQNEELNKVKKQQAREALGLVGPYEKLNRSRREAQMRLADLLAAETKNTKAIIAAQREYDELNRKVQQVDKAVDIFQKNIGNYQSGFSGLGEALNNLIGAFGVATGITLFSDAVSGAVAIIKDYEAEIVNLAAIAGKTRDEIAPLEQVIQDVAAASVNSATDVAKLATELIKLGSTPEEAEKLLKPVNDLSIALRASAEDSATLVKSLLNAYQEGADQATRFTDVLAESANRSALDFQGLRDAFSYLAPTAKTLNFSIEKTAAILGILADNGIKAEGAGRLTSTALIRLADNGLTLEDALNKINKAQREGADELETLAIAGNLFGAEAAKIGIILANNQGKIEENTEAYENAGGALAELTDKQLKSLDAQLKILDSSLEDYILNMDQSTGFTQKFTSIVVFLGKNLDSLIDITLSLLGVFITYKAAVLAQTVATAAYTTATNAAAVASAFAARGIAGARAEMQALNVATKLNPFAAITTGVIALIFYLASLTRSLDDTKKATISSTEEFLKARDTQAKNAQSIEQMTNRYEELDGKLNKTKEEQKELNELTKTLSEIVPDATEKVNKYGDAIKLSGDKLREYVKLQRETIGLRRDVEIEKNTKLLERQRKELENLTRADKEQGISEVKTGAITFTEVTRQNGVLKTRNNVFSAWRDLNKEEQLLYKEQRLNAERDVAATEARIKALKGLEDQTKKTNAATAAGNGANETPAERTIAVIDAEIKAEKEKIDSLTYATRAEGALIDKRIATLQKERDAIYQTNKTRKDYAKIREEELNKLKKIDEDAYNLAIFRLNRIKAQNDEILDDVNATEQERADAVLSNEKLLTAIAEENAEKRLKDISRYNDKVRDLTDEEIATLLAGGEIKKKLTKDELLVIEQFQSERVNIVKDTEAKIDKIQLDAFEKRLQEQLRLNGIAINDDLIAENDRFNAQDVNNRNREVKIEEHEKKVAEIKRKYAIQALQDQIKAMETLLATETLTADKRKEIETNVSNAKKELSDLTLNYQQAASATYKDILLGEELSERGKKERLVELATQLKDELINLSNAIFDARIQKIDDEIARSEEYYKQQIELAGNDQRQKDLLEKEAEKKRQELEKKKREEQRKQAIFNKALKITETIANTAMGIMQAYAQLGPILGNVGAALVGAIGAIQLAAIIATPIPKYKGGRTGGPAEKAIVGDGGVSEVIESKDGRIRFTPATPTLVHLNEGDSVHSSKEAYANYRRAQLLENVDRETERAVAYHKVMNVTNDNGALGDIIEAGIQKGFKKAAIHIHNEAPIVDLEHYFWAMKNINW